MKHEIVARKVKFGGFFAHMKFDWYALHFCYISIFVDFIPLHVSDSMHSNNTDDVAVLYERRWTYRRYRVDIFGKF